MRPHRLRFAGIGPYPGLVEIDFDELSALGLYLIVGPTGAGKTTIFDAITFALYGKVAGDRPDTGIVSDHQHTEDPFVELEFSHRGSCYRVHRKPAIENKPPRPNEIRFTEFVGDDFVHDARTVTGTNAVNKSVTDLIGLDAAQFMRVMLLPQNEFQKFLLANSTDKEPLLRALFGTRLFEQIAVEIAESAKALWKDAEAKKEELERLRYVIREVVETLEADGLMHDLPDPDEVLVELVELLKAFTASAMTEQDAASERSTCAIEALAKAERDAERFDAGAAIKDLEREGKRVTAKVTNAAERLREDERAGRASQTLLARDRAMTLAQIAKRQVGASRAALVDQLRARVVAPVLEPLRDAAPTATPAQLTSELSEAAAKADAARKGFELAAVADTEVARRAKLEQHHLTVARQAGDEVTKLGVDLKTAKERLLKAKKLASGFVKLDRGVRELETLLGAADVTGTRKRLVAAQGADTTARAAYRRADEILTTARLARTRHLAGELAEHLAEGEQCPVCGSVEHPNKALSTADQDVDSLQAERDTAYERMTGAERLLTDAQAGVEAAEAAASKLPSAAAQKMLRTSADAAAQAVDDLEELESAVGDLATLVVDEEKRHDGGLKDAKAEHQQQATFQSQAEHHRAAARLIIDEAALETVEKLLVGVRRCVIDFDKATGEHLAGASRSEQASVQAKATLHHEGFAKDADVAKAILDEAARDQFQTMVDDANERTDRINHLRGVVGKATLPATRPNVTALADAKTVAQTEAKATAELATALRTALTSIEKQRRLIAKLGPDVDRTVERAQRAKHIAAVVLRGEQPLLGLERWVQRAVFEEVCDVASERIRELSHGRYVLTLESNGQRSRTRAAGLDLFVTDSHTGRTRPVQSLSGGEQFLTSLALALALAEVVQNRSGGIELSTLFIDEGFGSLDGDTLDTAVEVLRSLQDSGRTVGLISHVEAMRQELTVGIQVIPSAAGSSLKVLSAAA